MVEGEDVQLAVVAQGHVEIGLPCSSASSLDRVGRGVGSARHGARLHGAQLHHRHRGGADDRRRRELQPRQRDRVAARGLRRGRDQARAHGVGAGDRHQAVQGHRRGRPPAAGAARAGAREGRRSAGCRSARPAPTRSRCGRTSASSPGRATATSSPRCASSPARSSSSACTSTSGIDDPEKAIHVSNGMRVHVPVLLALSANSPFWRADADGPDEHPHADLPGLPAGGDPAGLGRLEPLRARHRLHGAPAA